MSALFWLCCGFATVSLFVQKCNVSVFRYKIKNGLYGVFSAFFYSSYIGMVFVSMQEKMVGQPVNKHFCRREAVMQHTIFSTGSDSYLLSQIIHAGPVCEYTKKNEKSLNTHFFRITTKRGAVFCNFKNKETARKSRGVLDTMLNASKKGLFSSKGDVIDVANIISFGKVHEFKNDTSKVYGFAVNVQTVMEKSSTIWLTYKSEEAGQNARRALYATVMSFYEPRMEDGDHSFDNLDAMPSVNEKKDELTYVEV